MLNSISAPIVNESCMNARPVDDNDWDFEVAIVLGKVGFLGFKGTVSRFSELTLR